MKYPFILLIMPLLMACQTEQQPDTISALTVDELAIEVTPSENREYSYTDKKTGYWYGRTHQDEPKDWFAGWNVDKRRIFSDYTLSVDGKPLSRKEAKVTVYPYGIIRQWEEAQEKLLLVDHKELLNIAITDVKGDSLSIALNEKLLKNPVIQPDALYYTPGEAETKIIKVVPIQQQNVTFDGNTLKAAASSGGFLIAYGTEAHCDSLIESFRQEGQQLLNQRKDRMNRLITINNPLHTNLPQLDRSLAWLTLTTDELINERQGKGIYAGLPWFNEYWGRDMFIAMPGAALVSGQFDCAKEIFTDFAKLQDRDPASATYGRVPNVANLSGVFYNTTDGTPRFVMQVEELLKYSGDQSFLKEIYPSVVLSIDQSIRNYTDEKGYLIHADADTWMDVKRDGIPGSPRGNRANDIQYVWHKQLLAGVHLAQLMKDEAHVNTWQTLADKLALNFEQDYCDKENILIYDHLNEDGTPDRQYRPNQLFCFELIKDEAFKQKVTRRAWEELVYPWGVASLAQWDLQFHPQHENWDYYHKDDAYHNGTVWLWNNGIAMQRMIEYDQVETAWKLFCNMNRQALKEGAVGSLSENADAHPRKGQNWASRSGAFLQAWSNAEHLRVWYQYFLGIRPDLMNGMVTIEPKLPASITELETSVKIGKGTLFYTYKNGKFDIRLTGDNAQLNIILPKEKAKKPVFEGVDFCQPQLMEEYPCFSK